MQSNSVFLNIAKFADFWWKMLMSAELKGCVTWFINFLDLHWLRYNCAKFHHCRIFVIDFMKGGLFAPPFPIREQPRKSSSWILLRNLLTSRVIILRIKNPKFSGYCFYVNTNIQWDFQICVSVPLRTPLGGCFWD